MFVPTLSDSNDLRKGKRLQRKHINFLVDALGFALFTFLIGTGFLLRYALPPGSGGEAGSHGGERVVKVLWGLTRHEWGSIHFWISVGLMAAMALHLILHWRWIVAMVQGRTASGSGMRIAFGILGAAGIIFLAALPPLSDVQKLTFNELRDMRKAETASANPAAPPHQADPTHQQTISNKTQQHIADSQSIDTEVDVFTEIDGSATIVSIHQKYDVPVDYLIRKLGVIATDAEIQLGQLGKTNGFTMAQVQEFVRQYAAKSNN